TSIDITSRSSMRTVPEVGSISRLTILREVVLPQPLGPTRTQISPGGTVSERFSTAPGAPRCCEPERFVTLRSSTEAPPLRVAKPFVAMADYAVVGSRSPAYTGTGRRLSGGASGQTQRGS